METRIKYIKKNNVWHYAVQIKKWIFWKTVYTDAIFANVEKFIDGLDKLDDINSKINSLNKIVYDGWAVRNVYKSGTGHYIQFFDSYLRKRKTDYKSEVIWEDCNGNLTPMIEIKSEKLFGKECLDPMKLRITIERVEE